jgi:hypothetical protein
VVEIRLVHPVRVRAVVPMWIDRLAVSVREPDKLISLVRPPKEGPVTSPRRRAATTRRATAARATTPRPKARPKPHAA